MRFAELPVHPALKRALITKGYEEATPVQAAVLDAKQGRDLLVSSRTGSGKTVAFGIALAPTLMGEGELMPPTPRPLALVVAPTRELAQQVAGELAWLYGPAGGKIVTCVGGTDARAEARSIAHGAHIVVGTPGRLCDHLDRKNLRLDALRALVLDEADEMLDMGFREELERILKDAPPGRRTLLFSATLPKEITELAGKYQKDALRIAATAVGEVHADITYRAHLIAVREREHAVVNLLRAQGDAQALVFCETRSGVTRLHASLLERGFPAVAISGELTQPERTRALQALRDGRARVLVATDVAARGLDLPDIGLVIHADLPHDAEVLQHRSGRTGRAGKKGVAVLLVPFSKKFTAERMLGRARVKASFVAVPTAEAIRALDADRLVHELAAATAEPLDEDLEVARRLLQTRTPEQVASALVRLQRGKHPAPEDLPETTLMNARGGRPDPREARVPVTRGRETPPPARLGKPTAEKFTRPEAPREKKPFVPLAQDAGEVWFRINVGRERNADPKWLIPLLCRRGGITKAQIGKIRIQLKETQVAIVESAAARFAVMARKPDPTDPRIKIEPATGK
jgi:ATP-dependent RNA helicase DeaD